ncbi:MAG: hypothetical protein HY608_07045 [Planctomycetes bacterium]|nr:hypothetical protein [Planctomycetota bacterium]
MAAVVAPVVPALLWHAPSAGIGWAAGALVLLATQILLGRSIRSSWGRFGAAFAAVFLGHVVGFLSLAGVAYAGGVHGPSALTTYGCVVVLGTLLVGIGLSTGGDRG